jgi:acetylglutamate synthase
MKVYNNGDIIFPLFRNNEPAALERTRADNAMNRFVHRRSLFARQSQGETKRKEAT